MERPWIRDRAWIVYQRLCQGLPIGAYVAETPWLIYVRDPKGRTLLHVAAKMMRPEAVYALTNAGASILDTDHAGNTPLDQTSAMFIHSSIIPPRAVARYETA